MDGEASLRHAGKSWASCMSELKTEVCVSLFGPELGNWNQIRKLVVAEQGAIMSQVPKRLWVEA